MIESFGDSTRDGEWAAVRLRVDGDRIVEAGAPGLARPSSAGTSAMAAKPGGFTAGTAIAASSPTSGPPPDEGVSSEPQPAAPSASSATREGRRRER